VWKRTRKSSLMHAERKKRSSWGKSHQNPCRQLYQRREGQPHTNDVNTDADWGRLFLPKKKGSPKKGKVKAARGALKNTGFSKTECKKLPPQTWSDHEARNEKKKGGRCLSGGKKLEWAGSCCLGIQLPGGEDGIRADPERGKSGSTGRYGHSSQESQTIEPRKLTP